MAPAKTAVRCVWFVIEWMFACTPCETTLIDNDTAQTGAVTADPLGETRHDNVRTKLERLAQVRSRERRIADERQTLLVSQGRDGLQVANLQSGVTAALAEEGPSLLVGRVGKVLWIFGIDELDLDAHLDQYIVEHGVRPTIQSSRADDIITLLGKVDDRIEDRSRSRRHSESRQGVSSLKLSITRFQNVASRVHKSTVDVAELLQLEQVGRVLGVLEYEGRSAVDWNAARRALAQSQ
mmetsp:Transcript_37790/g.90402  ORF Transcript_37790/g.90402 Transcript_37790/m.90402 type:complete len:238 (+) Transcript_37790:732-1445(+)